MGLNLLHIAGLLPAALLIGPVVVHAGPHPSVLHVRLAVGSRPGNMVYLQVDLARALGYFADEGLDVAAEYFDGGTDLGSEFVGGCLVEAMLEQQVIPDANGNWTGMFVADDPDDVGKWTYEFDTTSSPGGTRLATKIAVCSVFIR